MATDAMDSPDPARRKDANPSSMREKHRGTNGRRTISVLRDRDGNIAPREFKYVWRVSKMFKLCIAQAYHDVALENRNRLGFNAMRARDRF
jgi:hypothetical protein